MAKDDKTKRTARRRTSVKDLPKTDKELTGKDLKKIKGGIGSSSDLKLKDALKLQ